MVFARSMSSSRPRATTASVRKRKSITTRVPRKPGKLFINSYRKDKMRFVASPSGCIATKKARANQKTPAEDAKGCLGLIRLGLDNTHLYIATMQRKKDPKIKGSTAITGVGYHPVFKWSKLYDSQTKKPYKVLLQNQSRYKR